MVMEIPPRHCIVRPFVDGDAYAVVDQVIDREGDPRVRVHGVPSGRDVIVSSAELRAGFLPGMAVREFVASALRSSRGRGHVIAMRELAGRDQVAVSFETTGEIAWIPFERLQRVADVRERIVTWAPPPKPGSAERVRLCMLAHLLSRWHQMTGGLAHIDVDPLPHQLHLVHHILRSGNLNWLIADDVGLGKTIEVGLLVSALRTRPGFERLLIVTPGGLVRQWREELLDRFGIDDARVYGDDFKVDDPRHWRLYPTVIASIDRLKRPEHLEALAKAPSFGLVVFDEAHRLSRRSSGGRLSMTQRFRAAQVLRDRCQSLLLLTATPHQGRADRFHALLELLRPELRTFIESQPHRVPEVLGDCVFRNRKLFVTDADGGFLFRGHDTRQIAVPSAPVYGAFEARLAKYFKDAAKAAARMEHRRAMAVGFVITIMRKLAASSPAAIHRSLMRRLERLNAPFPDEELDAIPTQDDGDGEAEDERFVEEEHARAAERVTLRFFDGEEDQLNALIGLASHLLSLDVKLRAFMGQIVDRLVERDRDARLLVFTEYRATLECVQQALAARFGRDRVGVIHGGCTMEERRAVVSGFNYGALQFVVSSEAGGEGLNLHVRCHTLVNYDLPWNPMRLVQRLGRLYRYGQSERVVMFNLRTSNSLDDRVVAGMYDRIDAICQDLCQVADEYDRERLAADLLGGLVSHLDVADVLNAARDRGAHRTEAEIEEAIRSAREALELHESLFSKAQTFEPTTQSDMLRLTAQHVEAFVRGMLLAVGCSIVGTTHRGRVLRVKLTPEVIKALRLGQREHLEVTTDKSLAARFGPRVEALDAKHPLLAYLVEQATSPQFEAEIGAAHSLPGGADLFLFSLKWQDASSHVIDDEFAVVATNGVDTPTVNGDTVPTWLATPAVDAAVPGGEGSRRRAYAEAVRVAEHRLAGRTLPGVEPAGLELVCGVLSGTRTSAPGSQR
ncbi:MAG: DEAD/DEAH box helicase [Myxococcales bacterium]|nr:DEAD/DEAH box helicase [Myxococcales bacterium]